MNKTVNRRIGRRHFLRAGTAVAAIGVDCLAASRLLSRLSFDSQSREKRERSLKYDLLIFGANSTYLSLFPRFNMPEADSPNSYQLILEASLTKKSKVKGGYEAIYMRDLHKAWSQDKRTEKTYFTLNTERFDIKYFLSPDVSDVSAISLSGSIFQGQLEKGGKQIMDDVVANIKRCIYCCQLNGQSSQCRPKAFAPGGEVSRKPIKIPKLEYLLFGNELSLFLTHKITRPPDFDQVLYLGSFASSLDFGVIQALRKGVTMIFPGRTNSVRQRIRVGQSVNGEIQFPYLVNVKIGKTMGITIMAEKETYFEEGELRMPPEFATTPTEKEAGFP